ncbi:MAG TPA: hypothetical protein PKG54_17150 [Phycisphaerae bacterium]|nr:hypothetical protein [Phycisphaerae bacterium]HOB76241.1 hypothetical protein [Phycisphaerae bacterium]HOJ56215.1 hypothetical protein [Phycisphaerae bacterium]HOL28059.1 hypothetical protein [Phycisphaerae bacterium]HPP22418.1 hypothetical protein [Phycisphaerae bacterium]
MGREPGFSNGQTGSGTSHCASVQRERISVCRSTWAGGQRILQYPLLDPDYLKTLLLSWPQLPPAVVLDIAQAAPGLSINETGSVSSPRFFQERLGYTCSWFKDMGPSPEECEQAGLEYPDPDVFLMEVAEDGIGNAFLVKKDGTLYMFEHEESLLRPCRTSVQDFLEAYFKSPEVIFDNEFLGVQAVPADAVSSEMDVPIYKAYYAFLNLCNLGRLALAVRCMQRARPASHLPSMPRQWQAHSDQLDELIEACRQVCVSGAPLPAHVAEEANAITRAAADRWCEKDLDAFWRMYGAGVFALVVQYVLNAAANIQDTEAAEWAAGKACEGFANEGAEWWAAIHADIDYLDHCNLGAPGSVGKPVPHAFFERDLWPGSPPGDWIEGKTNC